MSALRLPALGTAAPLSGGTAPRNALPIVPASNSTVHAPPPQELLLLTRPHDAFGGSLSFPSFRQPGVAKPRKLAKLAKANSSLSGRSPSPPQAQRRLEGRAGAGGAARDGAGAQKSAHAGHGALPPPAEEAPAVTASVTDAGWIGAEATGGWLGPLPAEGPAEVVGAANLLPPQSPLAAATEADETAELLPAPTPRSVGRRAGATMPTTAAWRPLPTRVAAGGGAAGDA